MKRKILVGLMAIMLSVSSFSVSDDMKQLIIMKQEALMDVMDKIMVKTKDRDKIIYLEVKTRKEKYKKFFSEYNFETMTDSNAEKISSTLSYFEEAYSNIYNEYNK